MASINNYCSFLGNPVHTLVAIPHSVYVQSGIDEPMVYDGVITLGGVACLNVEQVVLSDLMGREIYFGKERPTVAQWGECGQRAMLLLQELETVGAGDNPNLEPIMDMIQDIDIPETYGKDTLPSWRKCGLKALFLLKELGRLGAKDMVTLKPIMNRVNSIPVPETSERDKEMAGLHSAFSQVS
jgi:hypothetical protein